MVKLKFLAVLGLLSVFLLAGSGASSRNFDSALRSVVKPYHFSIAGWEFKTLSREAQQWLFHRDEKIDDEAGIVIAYFDAMERIRSLRTEIAKLSDNGERASLELELNRLEKQNSALVGSVEVIIERQVRETLTQLGIFNPLIGVDVNFPPVNFKLEEPFHLLVISPRDKIESMRETLLRQDTDLGEMEALEADADNLGISSLVVELGGFGGTYPTFVTNRAGLSFTIDAVVEEWLHQYLVFEPLGFSYFLDLTGISRDYDIATINETVASMVSKEIGAIVIERYYSEYGNGAEQAQTATSGFDFNREMREIRKAVDAYLAGGEIEAAEAFMEEKKQYLASQGYYIRKLNQAYFAFYGAHSDGPTSINPIGLELKRLRSQSASLKDFLDTVAAMTSRQALTDSLAAPE